eukprot:XP_014788334.1 PREDICTED: type-1A angiotensin II receptor-like [Octopus bimaculoides]
MNYSNTTTIEDINRDTFTAMRPAFIFITILMPVGIFGNAIAMYIYGFRFQKLPVHIFLICLAVFDMIGCLFGIPLEMVELLYPLMYPNRTLCKLERFVIYYSISTSTSTLFVIAVERYNKVCRHDKQQLSVRQAKIMSVIIGFLCIVVALPGVLFFDKTKIPISSNLNAQMCVYTSRSDKIFKSYFLISLLIDIFILAIMCLLYYRIWKVAKKHYTRANYTESRNFGDANAHQKNLKAYTKIRQTNKILVCITVLFVVSLIPGLILGIFYPLRYAAKIPVFVESLRQIGFRMWIFNGAMNPVVYGLLNSRFRQIFLNCLQNKSIVSSGASQ